MARMLVIALQIEKNQWAKTLWQHLKVDWLVRFRLLVAALGGLPGSCYLTSPGTLIMDRRKMRLSFIASNSLNQCLAKTGMSSPVYWKITHKKRFDGSSQNLKFPRGRLIFIIQAVSVEVKLPGSSLVLVIQTLGGRVKTQAWGSVSLGGKRSWGLIEVAGDGIGTHGAQCGPWSRKLVVHGGQIRSAVHAPEVGSWAGVALAIPWSLGVGHGVWPLHAGRGGGQGIWEWGDGSGAPDRDGGTAAGNGRDWGARGGSELAAGSALRTHFPGRRGLLFGRSNFVLASVLLLLLLLPTFGSSVLKPHLGRERNFLHAFTDSQGTHMARSVLDGLVSTPSVFPTTKTDSHHSQTCSWGSFKKV